MSGPGPFPLYPKMPPDSEHCLVLTPESGAAGFCDCGETFEQDETDAQVAAWETHILTVALLYNVRRDALAEVAARAATEDAIRRLLDLGLASGKIMEAIGVNDDTGRPLASKTLIQRIGRGEFVTTPRRRRA